MAPFYEIQTVLTSIMVHMGMCYDKYIEIKLKICKGINRDFYSGLTPLPEGVSSGKGVSPLHLQG